MLISVTKAVMIQPSVLNTI